jgi:16S rRNA (guanine966-N2)-methyltransferase
MRVISGAAKGRTLKPAGSATRPITDRVKESLFDILAARVVDANVLDLFAGAGSVGIEALSRGARAATFVELDRDALNAIRANLETTRLANRARVVRLDVFKFIRHSGRGIATLNEVKGKRSPERDVTQSVGEGRYDLIYVAPPQYKGLWAETLRALDDSALLVERGIVVAQIHPKEYTELALTNLELFDQRKYGSTLLCFYRRRVAATEQHLVAT